ncbi:hypothetical protein EV383_6245 [Pseudonocardia sediminis]|uniref:Uncharacterized protein n=1 Tax=Pseudonocardia sediminis TaxID=1397368 RepID=A0A4Q7U7I2_PSEST|nr:hypothetical protein [Pseudonocardia sediminis]RZT75504.1 hypothetical protein EV383_6245 [Pseudonocardia sediminis]
MSESQSAGVELIACEMPGCVHVIEYAGVGRKPKYCTRVVDGVVHNRLNAQKVRNGTLTLPAPGSRPERSDINDGEGPGSVPRPVSLARAGIEAIRDEIGSQLTAHQTWMSGATARLEELLAAATDPDAAAAEVAAAHREARTRIDAAEASAEDALARARAAEADATAAATGRAEAETAAEDALAERDELTEQRDRYAGLLADRDAELDTVRARLDEADLAHRQAVAERDQLAEQLTAARSERDRATAALAELREAHDALRAQYQQAQAERDTARTELTAARDDAAAQRRRAETLDRDRYAAEQARDSLTTELATARARTDDLAQAAAEARTAQAVTAAENTALTRQLAHDVEVERRHGEERLADLRERHADELRALRERDDGPAPPDTTRPDTALPDPDPAATTTKAPRTRRRTTTDRSADRSPRKARRRPGPEQTPDPQE